MRRDPRPPVLIADAEPLLRLAEADRLDALGRLGRTVVVVDRVAEAAFGDLTAPFAWRIREWAERLGDRLRIEPSGTPPHTAPAVALKAALDRFVFPAGGPILVLHEDPRAAAICLDAEVPMEFLTTRRLLETLGEGAADRGDGARRGTR
ncbi:hypothetical protein [Pinisolibacter aquiterrae]|uniref:hypothetical protein n=1 Tax=Pinisolibacter aquiterrae TaxID=2815579 RepID=UPI001C3DDD1C|nr:hypothetical protein [Pinisolibacter aquiterrae]MBV5263055.1 hypothetical protein [Pinisolibacter aquiterrae]MCC8233971.1 hypothetical protein [Pinisolibacter aquiterrae]